MTITKERKIGLLYLVSGIFSTYLGLESLLLVVENPLPIDSIRAVLGGGITLMFFGIWKLYSNKPKESKKELIVMCILGAILTILIRYGIN